MCTRYPKFDKFPLYSLPKLYGWHLMPKQCIKNTGSLYKYFGANWWDLLINKHLPTSKGKVTFKTRNTHAIILINMGVSNVKMTNKETGDVYNVLAGKRATVNNTGNRETTLVSDLKNNLIHPTRIGNILLLLLNVQEVSRDGDHRSILNDSPIFKDFLLMTGIPDKEQYLNTVGIEDMGFVDTQGWKFIDEDKDIKSDFVELLLDQWKAVNPTKRVPYTPGIPKKVQWIWLRRDVKKKEYGALKTKFFKFIDTWIHRNEDFEFNIWTDNPDFQVPSRYEGIVSIKGPNHIAKLLNKLPTEVRSKIQYLYAHHGNVGARSDTLRQVILYFEGGIYADINDAMCMSPLGKLFEKFDYIIGMEPVVYVNNAIIASKKHHPFSKAMIVWLAKNAREFVKEWREDYESNPDSLDPEDAQEEKDDYIVSTTGPIALTSVIFGVMKKGLGKLKNTLILPSSWVYPNYWLPQSSGEWLKPVSIFSHWDGREYLKSK